MASADQAFAQWKLLNYFSQNSVSAIYFLSRQKQPEIGFVGCGSTIYRTMDAGATWQWVLNFGQGEVTDFAFKDSKVGWASIMGSYPGVVLFKTTDGGDTWSYQFYAPGDASDVYYNAFNGTLLVSDRLGLAGGSRSSTNNGASWASFGKDGQNGFAFTDGYNGILSSIGMQLPFWRTTDGGRTWKQTTYTEHTWSPCVAPSTNSIYAPSDMAGLIYRSDDGGATWTRVGALSTSLTGCAQANDCAVFVQSGDGLFASRGGGGWTGLGGPGNHYDTRFNVAGPIIYAGDDHGNLYSLMYGGTVWPSLSFGASSIDLVVATGCGSATSSTLFRNLSCNALEITAASIPDTQWKILSPPLPVRLLAGDTIRIVVQALSKIPGTHTTQLLLHLQGTVTTDTTLPLTLRVTGVVPPTIDSITSRLADHCTPGDTLLTIRNNYCDTLRVVAIWIAGDSLFQARTNTLPLVLGPGVTGVLPLHLQPTARGAFTDSAVVTVRTADTEWQMIVPLHANVGRSELTYSVSASNLVFDTITPCVVGSQSTNITNTSCDSVEITELVLNGSDRFKILSPPVPLWIAGGDSVSVRIQYSGSAPFEVDTADLRIRIENGTSQQVSHLHLSGVIVAPQEVLRLSDTAIRIGNRAICASDTVVKVWLRNLGCDTLLCSSARIAGNVAFKLLNSNDTLLAPGDSVQKQIAAHLFQKGLAQSVFVVRVGRPDGSMSHDTLIPLSVNVIRGTALLACKTSALDLGTTPICKERDTFVVIQNTGCDTVCDSSVAFAPRGAAILAAFVLAKPWIGRCLAPGERDTVWLVSRMDTNGQNGQNVATLSIVSNADTALAPITLMREIQYPAAWHLTISAPDSAYSGQPVTYKLLQHGTLPNDDTAIDFVLHYDDDLLQFLNVDEPFARGAGFQPALHGMKLHIAPVPADSVVATLHFTTYLAPNQHTTLSIDGIAFSSSLARPSDCIALAQVDTSGFTLRTLCGAIEISKELNGLPLMLDAIVPNPSHSEVTLYYSLAGSESIPATVVLEDALGRTRLSQTVRLEAGSRHAIPIDLSVVPSGVYLMRLGPGLMKRIVKE